MADIFRDPLFSSRREIAPVHWITSALAVSSLLTTLLVVAGIPLPLSAADAADLTPMQILYRPNYNADTSHSTPKTLLADNQAPFFVAAHFAPNATRVKNWLPADASTRRSPLVVRDEGVQPFFVPAHFAPNATRVKGWLPAETSRSTAKELIADLQLPFAVPMWSAPERARSSTDTSLATPVTLFQFGPLPLPPGTITPTSLYRFFWQPQDSTGETPKGLTADAQTPFAIPQWPAPERTRYAGDTSLDTPTTLFPLVILPPPPGAATPTSLYRFFWQPQDVTSNTPKSLTADGTQPFSIAPRSAPERVRQVVDTTWDTWTGLLTLPLPPGRAAPQWTPDYRSRYASDTSQDTPTTLLPVVSLPLPPGQAAYFFAHRARYTLPDTSASVAKTLYSDARVPVFNAPAPVLDAFKWRQLVGDTFSPYRLTLLTAVIVPGGVFGNPQYTRVVFAASPRLGVSPDSDGSPRIGGIAGGPPKRIGS